jgi:hypothetical protein
VPSRRTSLLFVLLLLMELLPGFVLLVGTSLLEATTWGYGFFWLLAPVAFGGVVVGLMVSQRMWRDRRHRTAVVVAGAALAGLPAISIANGVVTFLASFILLGIAFWRGLVVTLEPPGHDEAQRRLALGFAILFFGILWVIARGIIGERLIWQMLAAAGIAFIVVSMLALVIARLAQVREPGAGGAIALAVLIQLGVLLLLSLLGLQLFALDLAGLVGHALQPFFDSLGNHLYGLVGYIADPINRLLQLIRPHGKPASTPAPAVQTGSEAYGKRPKYHPPVHSPLVAIAALLVVAAMAAGIGYAIWRAVPRSRPRPTTKRAFLEERRSSLSMSSIWRSLLASLRALFRRGTRGTTRTLAAGRRRVWGPAYPADPVRRTYAQLLRRSDALGLRMQSSSTPLEFQSRLADRWPQGAGEIDLLTATYMRRRYGELDPVQGELASLAAAWQRLRHIIKGPSRAAARLERGRASLAAARRAPEHERPERPFPRDRRATRWTETERTPWRPSGIPLLVLSFALPALVIVGFLVILLIAGGRLG